MINIIAIFYQFISLTIILSIFYIPGFLLFFNYLRFLKNGKVLNICFGSCIHDENLTIEEYEAERKLRSLVTMHTKKEVAEISALWGSFLMLLVLFVSLFFSVNSNNRMPWIISHVLLIALFIIFIKLYLKVEPIKKKEPK